MIERPQHPIIRIMTFPTILTHPFFVNIIFGVTSEALGLGLFVFPIDMAGFTSGDTVNANQGKMRYVVFEKQFSVPTGLIVTITTILSEIPFVDIDRPMTGDASRIFQIVHGRTPVTGMTA
jgi:hypothetical protein